MSSITRHVQVVDSTLAFRMGRLAAARAGAVGLDVLTLPLLAARLAGGFCRIADRDLLATAIQNALAAAGFAELEGVRELPGMVRAVTETLRRLWFADLRVAPLADTSPRLRDLDLLAQRIRAALPPGALLPQDLRDAAIARVHFAPVLFGTVLLDRLIDVDPVWRPLVCALAAHVPVRWIAVGEADRAWFPGTLEHTPTAPGAAIDGDLCADPRSEVVEALRWTRALLSRGDVAAADIAIVSAAPETWDEAMLVLSRDADLPIYFSHGAPALSTWEGQACAGLADIVINGLSQDRVRRMLRQTSLSFAQSLPPDWSVGIPRRAGLFTVEAWRRALTAARPKRADPDHAERVLLPLLHLLAQGPLHARDLGALVLSGASLGLWKDALRNAPAAAIALSLQMLRVRDDRDPGNSVVWGPAAHLVGAPRKYMRLIGLTGRSWPRVESEDALLPNHILRRRRLIPVSATERDRHLFDALLAVVASERVLSRSHRSADGALQCASALWPNKTAARLRVRTRTPEHAFSEADRLLARPAEAGQLARIKASRACWRHWHRTQITPNDGLIRADHPAVARAVGGLHSAKSLRRLARDPLGFLWRYAIAMRSPPLAQQPFAFDALMFGELVHELLRQTVNALEPNPGFVRASRDEVDIALGAAVADVRLQWPLQRPVPPPLLWEHALEEAARQSLIGLTVDEAFQPGTRSWTELAFGAGATLSTDTPWALDHDVLVGQMRLRLGGRMDRVDVAASGDGIRISDYKTGQPPPHADRIVLDRGRELQRVLYAMAAHQLRPGATMVISRLIYLDPGATPYALRGERLEAAAADVTTFLDSACALLRRGTVCPGPGAQESYNDLRLALPAELDGYFRRKGAGFAELCRELSALWSKP